MLSINKVHTFFSQLCIANLQLVQILIIIYYMTYASSKRYLYKFIVEGIAHGRMERKGYSKWFWIENDKEYSLEGFFIQNDALYAFL